MAWSMWKVRKCIPANVPRARVSMVLIIGPSKIIHIAPKWIVTLNFITVNDGMMGAFPSTTAMHPAVQQIGAVVCVVCFNAFTLLLLESTLILSLRLLLVCTILQPHQVMPLCRHFEAKRPFQRIRKWCVHLANWNWKLAKNWMQNEMVFRVNVKFRHIRIAFKNRMKIDWLWRRASSNQLNRSKWTEKLFPT